jgi:hypothetical protein
MRFDMHTYIAPFAGLVLAALGLPAQAQVQAGCTGSNPGTVNCPGSADGGASNVYATGIIHNNTAGDITVNSGNGITSYGTGGFVTTATGAHSITMTKGTGNLATAAATGTSAPVVIGATSVDGDISISTAAGNVAGVATAVQYGIRAQSTGGGDVRLGIGGIVSLAGAAANPGIAAISAQTGGGDIEVITGSGVNITGRQYGIQTIASGAGDITITTGGTVGTSTTAGVGLAAIQAVADTGVITLNLDSNIGINGVLTLQGNGLSIVNLRNTLGGGPNNSPAQNAQNNARSAMTLSGSGQVVINIAGGSSYGSLFGGFNAAGNTGGMTVNNEEGSG